MTKFSLQLNMLAGLLLVLTGNASAATYTNVPAGATSGSPFAYFGNAANPSGDSPRVGEVFSLTAAATMSSFNFYQVWRKTPGIHAGDISQVVR